jgi:hypothetical protein
VTRFRLHSALAVAGVVAVLSAFSLAAVGGFWLLTPLVPLIFTLWAWRAGTDADQQGLRIRSLLTTRSIPWSMVTALAVTPRPAILGTLTGRRDKVVATLDGGRAVTLTAVRPADLHTLVAASGQPLSQAASAA